MKGKNDLKVASKNLAGRFLEVFWVDCGFWWGPLGSQVSDPPSKVEDGVGSYWKIGLCADLEDIKLHHYFLTMGMFFEGSFR